MNTAAINRQGLILVGSNGTRLAPLTTAVRKQLASRIDQRASNLMMLAGNREALVTTPPD